MKPFIKDLVEIVLTAFMLITAIKTAIIENELRDQIQLLRIVVDRAYYITTEDGNP